MFAARRQDESFARVRNPSPSVTADLDHARADSLIKEYLAEHSAILAPLGVPASPLTTQNAKVQDAENYQALQYQCQTHQQMGGLLAAFAFAALVGETETRVDRISSGPGVLISLPDDSVERDRIVNCLDQIRLGCVALSMCLFIRSFMTFVYVDMWLTSSACRKIYLAFAGAVTKECATFHHAMYLLLFSVPLYLFKFFGLSIVFFLSLFLPFFVIGTLLEKILALSGLQNIANHLEMGTYGNTGVYWTMRSKTEALLNEKAMLSLPEPLKELRRQHGIGWRWSERRHEGPHNEALGQSFD